MREARTDGRPEIFEDRRMWRLMLARLHPDAGGDHDLFAFACAMKEELSANRPVETRRPSRRSRPSRPAEPPFLRGWRDTMGNWSSQNRGVLKDFLNR